MCYVPEFRRNFIGIILLLTCGSTGYFIVNFSLGKIGGDLLDTTIISGSTDVCTAIVAGILYSKLGPRKAFFTTIAIAYFGGVLLLIFKEHPPISIYFFFFFYKLGTLGMNNMSYSCIASNIPQAYNTTVFGICNIFAKIVTASAPVVAEEKFPFPLYVNFGLYFIGIIGTCLLLDKLPKCI